MLAIILGAIYVQADNGETVEQATKVEVNLNNDEDLSDATVVSAFQQYIKDFDRVYNSLDEINAKYEVFRENYVNMKGLQKKYKGRTDKNEFGITQFMDMKPSHFEAEFMTAKISPEELKKAEEETVVPLENDVNSSNPPVLKSGQTDPPVLKAVPSSWDWRSQGIVSPVKSQGRCGSCYAHSAVGNIESQYAKKYGAMKQFSEEQIVDCDYGNDGCVGGNQELAFTYLKRAGGLVSQANYPYQGKKTTCQFKPSQVAVKVKSYFFAGTNEEKIKNYVYTNGPMAIVFNAKGTQYYKGGIINSSHKTCDPNVLNHAVLIVGYGTEQGQDYWIVKNSYGPSWGENGYFRMARGKGTCGINKYVLSAVLA